MSVIARRGGAAGGNRDRRAVVAGHLGRDGAGVPVDVSVAVHTESAGMPVYGIEVVPAGAPASIMKSGRERRPVALHVRSRSPLQARRAPGDGLGHHQRTGIERVLVGDRRLFGPAGRDGDRPAAGDGDRHRAVVTVTLSR